RDRDRIGPAAGHVAARIEVPADTVVAVVLATGIVDMENDELGPTVAVDIGDRDASTLVFATEPARDCDGVRPAAGHVAVRVEVPADAVVAVVLATGVVDVEDDELRPTVAVEIGDRNATSLVLAAEPTWD